MTQLIHRSLLTAMVLVGAITVAVPAQAQKPVCVECRQWQNYSPNLNNGFAVPNHCGGVPTQLYVSPGPVPQFVGHTYITYQPLMPHQFLYPHVDKYHRYYDQGRGMTRARAAYVTPRVKATTSAIMRQFRVAR
ncbi:MAG TPA: hypothetical protein EYG57_17475 [Planctomycetes bacterium]|nr:hypothetical protein [Planctomycetaceae bacterium]HIM31321.1 hypothetical protein [Planctomycetota bacterium]